MEELDGLLRVRKLKKIRDTYLDAFANEQVNGVVHPFFNLHLVRTYRSSASNPNMQNIPKRDKEAMQIVRKAIYPRKGHQLVAVDYSGLEVRISTCLHRDSRMLKYINNPASDMHSDVAKQIFKLDTFNKDIEGHTVLRNATKNGFVFPVFYGDYYKNCAFYLACNWGGLKEGKWKPGEGIPLGDKHLSDHLISQGLTSYTVFTKHIQDIEDDFWKNRFPEYAEWKERWWKMYQKHGYIVMHTGFRCSGVMGKNDCVNYPIQGSAFHCLLWSFIESDRVMREEKWDTKIIGQIHDEIILDVHPDELDHVVKTIKRITCVDLPKAWDWIIVPLDVGIEVSPVDASWAEKKITLETE